MCIRIMGYVASQFIEVLRHKSEGRGVRFPVVCLEFF